jgi:hypothetical protein
MTPPCFLPQLGLLASCYKEPAPGQPEDLLPPATQAGANTFGCLVNGQPWTPQGGTGLTPNYSVVVDPGFQGGTISISAQRYTNAALHQAIIVGGDSIKRTGKYSLADSGKGVLFKDLLSAAPCQELVGNNNGDYHRGTLVLTRYDLSARIVSGTFDFTLHKPGCDSIRVTHGRFDYKF